MLAGNLLNPLQSGFHFGNSCFHQLLSITYDIYKADANPSLEVTGIFSEMPKTFDRAWKVGLLFTLKRLGFSGKYYSLINSFLKNRRQKVTPSGQSSMRSPIIDRFLFQIFRVFFWGRFDCWSLFLRGYCLKVAKYPLPKLEQQVVTPLWPHPKQFFSLKKMNK